MKCNSLSNIHVFKFAFGCLFSSHTAFKMHGMHNLILKILPKFPPPTFVFWLVPSLDRTNKRKNLPSSVSIGPCHVDQMCKYSLVTEVFRSKLERRQVCVYSNKTYDAPRDFAQYIGRTHSFLVTRSISTAIGS